MFSHIPSCVLQSRARTQHDVLLRCVRVLADKTNFSPHSKIKNNAIMSFLCRVLSKEVYKNIVIDVAPHLHYPFSLLNFFRAHLLLLLWGI